MNCSICRENFEPMFPGDIGHNPEPVRPYSDGTCCNDCEYEYVIPSRGVPPKLAMKLKEHNNKLLEEYNVDAN